MASGGDADPTYHGPDPRGRPLARALDGALEGEVRADEYTRHLYATDASLYRAVPEVVVYPTDRADVVATVAHCRERGVPILPRGGGTSLAGQAVNEAVVLDFTRHMDRIDAVDAEGGTVRVGPGAVLGELDAHLAEHDLIFPPDPAWGNHSTVGGAIANNSAGAHSLAYGPTDRYLETVEVVLLDGTAATFGPTAPAEIAARADPDGALLERIYAEIDRLRREEAATIEGAYPALERNVAGYNLPALLEPDAEGRINLARLLAASEGTLGVITGATLRVVTPPAHVGAALLSYGDLSDAMGDVAAVLEHDPAAVESLDAHLLEKAREHPAYAEAAAVPPPAAEATLLVECFDADADALEARLEDITAQFGEAGRALDARHTTDPATRDRFWHLRKAALPLMLSETTDAKHVALVEDAAVPPSALPAFVEDFAAVLDEHGTHASFYGHAGAGVLHVRPLIDTHALEGRERMRAVAEGAYELVQRHGGTVSGEHGDGRARTEWTRRQYGEEVTALFERLKRAFDPDGLFNPGPITGDVALDRDHRIEVGADPEVPFDPALSWDNPNGVRGMVELCHGCGGCRGSQATAGGVMCPTYRASGEEIATTRGRANLLREAIHGRVPPETLFDERFEREVLSLCIGCKGCLHDCPSGVDLATVKAELRHQRHRRRGATRRERLFAAVSRIGRLGSVLAPASNLAARLPGAGVAMERLLGLTPRRRPPAFAGTSFLARSGGRHPRVDPGDAPRALVVPDPYTNFFQPDIGTATVTALEGAGVHVAVPDTFRPLGRPTYSQGFLEVARGRAEAVVDALHPQVADGWDVVVPEPSAAAMLQHDYAHLLDDTRVADLAAATWTPMAYLNERALVPPIDPTAGRVAVHEHCHQHALGAGDIIGGTLRDLGYDAITLESGCCGMAGSFGYEREHYDLSVAIGDILLEQVDAVDPDAVLAPGTSCRSQLEHLDAPASVTHPIERVAADVTESP